MDTHIVTVAERPTLAEGGVADELVWPGGAQPAVVAPVRGPSRLPARAARAGQRRAPGGGPHRALPLDGTDAGLPRGIDGVLPAAVELLDRGGSADTLCAVAAEIHPDHRGRDLATVMVEAMGAIVHREGLEHLIAPARPSLEHRYPMVSIARYVTWRREDGQLFDPWMRIHERLGPTVPPLAGDHRERRAVGGLDRHGLPRLW